MFLMKCYWMLQNVIVTAFTVSELLKLNQQGGVILPKDLVYSSHYNHGRKYDCHKGSQKLFVLVLIGLKILISIWSITLNLL